MNYDIEIEKKEKPKSKDNINKISSFNQILNSIDNIDEFFDIRKQLNNLFTDIENDTNTLIKYFKSNSI